MLTLVIFLTRLTSAKCCRIASEEDSLVWKLGVVSGRGNLRIDVCEGEQRAWSSLASSPDRIKVELFGLLMIADGHTEPAVLSKDTGLICGVGDVPIEDLGILTLGVGITMASIIDIEWDSFVSLRVENVRLCEVTG